MSYGLIVRPSEPPYQHSTAYMRVKKWMGKHVTKNTTPPINISPSFPNVTPLSDTQRFVSAESLYLKKSKGCLQKVASDPKLKPSPLQESQTPQPVKLVELNYTKENDDYFQSLSKEVSETICTPNLLGCHNLRQLKQKIRSSFQNRDKLEIAVYNPGCSTTPIILFYRHPWYQDRISFRFCSEHQNLRQEVKKLSEEIQENRLYQMAAASKKSKASDLWKPADPKQQDSIKKLLAQFDKLSSKEIFQLISDEYTVKQLRNNFKKEINRIYKYEKKGSKLALELENPQEVLIFKQLYTMLSHISWQISQPQNAAYSTITLVNLAVGSCYCKTRLKEEALQAYRQLTQLEDAPDSPSLPVFFNHWVQSYKDELLDLTVAELNVTQTSHVRFGIAKKLEAIGIYVTAIDLSHSEDKIEDVFKKTILKGFKRFLNYYHPSGLTSYCENRLADLLDKSSTQSSCEYKAFLIQTLKKEFEGNYNNHMLIYEHLLQNQFILEDPKIDALKTVTRKGMQVLLKQLGLIQKL